MRVLIGLLAGGLGIIAGVVVGLLATPPSPSYQAGVPPECQAAMVALGGAYVHGTQALLDDAYTEFVLYNDLAIEALNRWEEKCV